MGARRWPDDPGTVLGTRRPRQSPDGGCGHRPRRPRSSADAHDVHDGAARHRLRAGRHELRRTSASMGPRGGTHRRADPEVPRRTGRRPPRRRGGTTVSAPGAQGALDRSADVLFRVEGQVGTIRRPTLQGAILSKAAALEITGDDTTRHLVDIATLGALVTRRDDVGANITATERRRALTAAALIRRDATYARLAGVDPSVSERLRLAFTEPPLAAPRTSDGGRIRRADPGHPADRGR